MKYSYYPGCTLRNKAKDLDEYARASARALGFELEEIEDWQCCGGVYPLGTDEIATKLSSVRALNQAKEKGQDLVTICSACHHVIKRVNDDMKNVEDIRTRANNYMQLDEPYEGETPSAPLSGSTSRQSRFRQAEREGSKPAYRKENRSLLRMSLITSGQDHGF